jgi:hypothetical protein
MVVEDLVTGSLDRLPPLIKKVGLVRAWGPTGYPTE